MPRKISLSVLTFTYVFAGLSHFTRAEEFIAWVPAFIPDPPLVVSISGGILLFVGFLLPFPSTRKWGCSLALLGLGLTLGVDLLVLSQKGMGIPLPFWVLVVRVPFHLLLMGWTWSHFREPKGP